MQINPTELRYVHIPISIVESILSVKPSLPAVCLLFQAISPSESEDLRVQETLPLPISTSDNVSSALWTVATSDVVNATPAGKASPSVEIMSILISCAPLRQVHSVLPNLGSLPSVANATSQRSCQCTCKDMKNLANHN